MAQSKVDKLVASFKGKELPFDYAKTIIKAEVKSAELTEKQIEEFIGKLNPEFVEQVKLVKEDLA